MAVNYEVTQVYATHINVNIPELNLVDVAVKVYEGETVADVERRIGNNTQFSDYDTPGDVPFQVGDTGTAKTPQELSDEAVAEAEATRRARVMTYEDLRARNYPTLVELLVGLREASSGDSTKLDAVYAEIDSVNTEFPETLPPTTIGDYEDSLDA